MNKPICSVLIPVYNRENMIGDCIVSALEQSVKNLEVIVVDNQSTDNTWKVCEKFAAQDPRVRVFRNESNVGPVRNWQRCIAEAKGRYAKLLFSDDLMAPDCLENCLPFLESEEVGFVFTKAFIGSVPWTGEVKFNYQDEAGVYDSKDYLKEALFGDNAPVSPAAALFRLNDLRKNLTFDIPSPCISDFAAHGAGPDLLIYLLTAVQYPKIAYCDKPLMFFRAHEGSISVKSNQNYLHHAYRQAKIWFAENNLHPQTLQKVYAIEWKRHCKREKKWSLPARVFKNYSTCRASLAVSEIVDVIVKRSRDWKKDIVVKLSDIKST